MKEHMRRFEKEKKIDSSLQIKDVDLEGTGIINRILDSTKKVSFNLYKSFINLFAQNNYIPKSQL